MIDFFRILLEKQVFGVSSWLGNRIGIQASFIRLFFIYAAFINVFTILIYLGMVFILKIRTHFKYRRRKSVFDL